MFNNVKAKKRLTQAIVSFIVICMTLTGSFLLLEDSVDTVHAETVGVSTKGQWDNYMSEIASKGGNWTIRLDGDITLNSTTGGKLAAIPANANVTLNMNGHNIIWDYLQQSGNWNSDLMATSYTSGTYANGEYWGFITNNGTLTISGTGTIRNSKVHITRQKTDKNEAVQRLATIVNNGTLSVGGNITIEAYLTSVHNSDGSSYSDDYLYNFGIYSSSGTVTSSAKIYVGGMVGCSANRKNARGYNHCYGIYGDGNTKLNVNGGNIYVDSFAGGFMETSGAYTPDETHIYASSVGIFGNNTIVTGDTTIKILSKNWEFQDQNHNTWKNGADHLFSVGVMYVGSNYPVIGPSVDIVSSFEHIGDNKTTVYVPGVNDANGNGIYWSNVYSDSNCNNSSHVATPIAGVSGVNSNIGAHKSEVDYGAKFFGGTTPWESIGNGADANRQYKTAQSYYSATNTTVVAPRVDNGSNDSTRQTATIVNGAPGNTGSGAITSAEKGAVGQYNPNAAEFKKGAQYLVVYRYYTDLTNISSVSFRADSAKLDKAAVIKVGGAENKTGIVPDNTSKVDFTDGAKSKNDKYYTFVDAYYERVASNNVNLTSRLNDIASGNAQTPSLWSGSKTMLPEGGIEVTADNVLVIYLDYKISAPKEINIFASNDTVNISTTSKAFSVPYKGAAITPGVDFQIGIISNDTLGNKANETSRYDISGTGLDNSKVNIEYSYYMGQVNKDDNVDWQPNLPKDVGTYTIKVQVSSDTTYSEASRNLQAKTDVLTCTISKVDADITGSSSRDGVYGVSYSKHIPFGEYQVAGKGSDKLEGSWSFAGLSADAVPGAGQSTVYLVWTPTAGTKSANNYNSTTFPVTLNVAKKAVTVNAGPSSVQYGDSKPAYTIEYVEGLADIDKKFETEYLNNSAFLVKNASGDYVRYNLNEWVPGVGTYDIRLETFGGADNENYTFTLNSKDGLLTVNKRNIVYTASATDRAYNGSDNVDVTLKYASGNLTGDTYDATINTTGKMVAGADAANGKQVTVDVNSIVIENLKNYTLVISNADSITVNITKATPTGVRVVAEPSEIVYDATATLEKNVSLSVTESNPNIPGNWSWVAVDGVSPTPTVDVTSYKAVFTPADTLNYTTLEQDVALIVEQKEVKVSVKDPKTGEDFRIQYGDAVPAISGSISYVGFTGKDNITNIGANGGVDATTTYTRGAAVNTVEGYAVNVDSTLTSTNYYFTAVPAKIFVEKRNLTVTVLDQNVTFGAPVPELNVSDLKFDGFYNNENYTNLGGTVVVTTTYTPGASAGVQYPVTASGYTSANYNIDYVDGVLTVNKAVLTVVPNDVQGVQYGADAPDYAGSKLYSLVDAEGHKVTTAVTGDPVFTTQYKSGKDAGIYPVTVSVNNMSATNYSFVGQEGTLTVGKADPKINERPGATVVNTHKFSEAIFDGTEVVVNPYNSTMTVEGTFAFVDADKTAIFEEDGMYDVVFTPADTYNYNVVYSKVADNGGVWLVITEKLVTGKPVIQGSAMAGSTLTLVLDSMDPSVKDYYNIEWYANGAKLSGVNGLTYTLQTADIGKTFKVKLIPSKGFTNGGTDIWSDPTSAVIEALLETTAAQFKAIFAGVEYAQLGAGVMFDDVAVEYDSFRHPVTISIADAYNNDNTVFADDYVVKYNGLTEAPKNAGVYTVTVDIGVPESKTGTGFNDGYEYYGPATGIVLGQFEITKATLNLSIAVEDKIYDGTTTVNATVFPPLGLKDEMDIVNIAPGSKFSFADPNVGQNKEIKVTSLALTGKQANNYQIDTTIDVTANILPRTIYYKVYAPAEGKEYDGTPAVGVTFAYDVKANDVLNAGYAAVDSATSVYPTNGTANASSANATEKNGGVAAVLEDISCVLAGSSAKNYVAAFSNAGEATVVITQAEPVVEIPVLNGVTYSAARTLSTYNEALLKLNPADGSWIFKNGDIVPTVNQKTYAAIFTPNDKNYKAVEKQITVNVEPLSVTIWPEDTTISYGSKSPVIKVGPASLPDGTLLSEISGSCTPIHSYYPGASIGSYTVTLNNAYSDDNYSFTTIPGTLTVAPARLNVTAAAADKVYDGTADINVTFTVVSGKYGNDDVALNEMSTIGQAATANAGPTTVTYLAPILVGSKAENYELNVTPASGVLSVTINKADVSGVIFPVDATVEFGYDLRYAEFAINGVGDGTFAFENAKDIVPPAVDFYEYKVIFTPRDSRNYNTQERVVSLEVVKCVLDYIVGVAGTAQEGETLSVVFTGLPAHAEPYMNYQWYRINDKQTIAIPGATEQKYVATEDDIGYTIAVVTYIDEAQAPFVYAEGACEEGFGETDIRCIVGASDSAIKEVALTFWQRLLDWIRRIIAAITGVQLNGGIGG